MDDDVNSTNAPGGSYGAPQRVPTDGMSAADLEALKKKISVLQALYLVLFLASLVLLVARWTTPLPGASQLVWAVTLGGAVVVRIYRTSLVNKYNAELNRGRSAPLV